MALFAATSSESAIDVSRWPAGLIPHETLHESVFLVQDEKILYVATDVEESNINLASFISRLKFRGFDFKVEWVSPEDLREKLSGAASSAVTESEVQKAVMELLGTAVKQSASDIHIDIMSRRARLAFRINGQMVEHKRMRVIDAHNMVQVIYNTMCSDIQTAYVAKEIQDGQFSPEFLPSSVYGIRLNRGPRSDGEYMSLRLHRDIIKLAGSWSERLRSLGYSKYHIMVLSRSREQPKGMIIFAGTTGSGKTTSLKHTVECCAEDFPGAHYVTVEDPVELVIEGVRQIPVIRSNNEEEDAQKFNAVLRSLLRQDPDRIMVGEIRDEQTADICIQAAQSGHQILTTIHAGTPFGIIDRFAERLRQAGYPSPVQTLCQEDVLIALVQQSLVPVLCEECKIKFEEYKDELPANQLLRLQKSFPNPDDLKKVRFRREGGCKKCHGLGIAGRTVVAEIVPMDRDILDTVRNKGVSAGRDKWLKRNSKGEAKERTLQGHVRSKVLEGIVDPIRAAEVIGPLMYDIIMEDKVLDDDELKLFAPVE